MMKQFFTIIGLYVGSFLLLSVIVYFIKGKHPFQVETITTHDNKIIQISTSDKHGILVLDNEGNIFAFSIKQKKWILVADKNTKVIK